MTLVVVGLSIVLLDARVPAAVETLYLVLFGIGAIVGMTALTAPWRSRSASSMRGTA